MGGQLRSGQQRLSARGTLRLRVAVARPARLLWARLLWSRLLWLTPLWATPLRRWLLAVALVATLGPGGDSTAHGQDARQGRQPPGTRSAEHSAVDKALGYLQREVPAWRAKNGCYSCHNNGDGLRTLLFAKSQGIAIGQPIYQDSLRWLARPEGWKHNGGDGEFNDLRLARIQFGATLALAQRNKLGRFPDPLKQVAKQLVGDQQPDGYWSVERALVGSPATYGKVLATVMSVQVLRAAGGHEEPGRRATAWLRSQRPPTVLDAAATLWAAGELELPVDPEQREHCLKILVRGQRTSGGWGPYVTSPPEPFDTAVALLGLQTQLAALPADRRTAVAEQIGRGREFLRTRQLEDGSWDETTRPAGGQSYAQRISTVAWAARALLATHAVPALPHPKRAEP